MRLASPLILTLCPTVSRGSEQSLEQAIAAKFQEIQTRDLYNADGQLFFPGGTLAVVLPSDEALSFAVGHEDRETGLAMAKNRRLPSGSVGKMFAGALATRLIVDGRLDPDTKIAPYFSHEAWFEKLPNKNDITIRHLLQHSSGLISYYHQQSFLEFMRDKTNPTASDCGINFHIPYSCMMEFATEQPPLFPAGSNCSYSENGYLLLGAILGKVLAGNNEADEDVFRAAYYKGLKELVLDPMNIQHTTPLVGRSHANLSQGYVGEHAVLVGFCKKILEGGMMVLNPTFEFAGGGLVTTSLDLAHSVRGISKGSMYRTEVESKKYRDTLLTQGPADERGRYYGFGPFIRHMDQVGTIIGHGGTFPGYRALALYFQRFDLAIAIQVNAYRNDRLGDYAKEIAGVILPRLSSH